MKRKLFYKIFFPYLVIISLFFFLLNLLIKDEVKEAITAKTKEELLNYAQMIDLSDAQAMPEHLRQIALIAGARVTLVDAQGKVFADTEKDFKKLDNHLNLPEIQEARLRKTGTSMRFNKSLGADVLYVAIAVSTKNQISGYVRLARPLNEARGIIEKVYKSIFLLFVAVVTLSLGIALFVSYRLAAPIQAMEKFTQKLREGKKDVSSILQTKDETKTLADNINYLVEELQNKIRQANEEKSKLMTALTSINEGVLILNIQDKIEFVSPSLTNIMSQQYGNIGNKTLMEAFRNVDLQKVFLKFKEKRAPVVGEISLGSAVPVIMRVSISAVHGYPSEEKVMVVFHDITRLKKLETIRTDFVANVTHEIRTPLTAIIGYLETIQAGAIDNKGDTERFVDIMLRQASRLNRLVEDLMTISQIELGEMNFRFSDVLISDVLAGVLPLIEPKAKSKNIAVTNLIVADLSTVWADRDRMSQILVNILDNAVKFTPDNGSISISADEDKDFITVNVIDSGIGVPREEIQRLGERFYRVDKTRSRELGGTGLGLSIVKHLMNAHGGKMEIESRLGSGTKISLFFPKARLGGQQPDTEVII